MVNCSNDVIIYTVNSFILQQNLPNAQLILYPDAKLPAQYFPTMSSPITRANVASFPTYRGQTP